MELNAEDGYEKIFGTGLTTDAMREAIAGGAKTIIACILPHLPQKQIQPSQIL
mgnify:CR=1 FL=1